MVNLFPEFAGNAASAIGSGIGGVLGQLGDIFSAPRRALWKALGAPESGAQVAENLGVGDRDSLLSKIVGTGLEIAGDPLTFAMGPILRGIGGLAGKTLSKGALAAGPGYSDDIAKLSAGLGSHENPDALMRILGSEPDALRAIAREVPDGSSLLGMGAEGVAYKTPTGGVVRLERGIGQAPPLRPDVPEVLQPVRAVRAGDLGAEHLPMVQTLEGSSSPLYAQLDAMRKSPVRGSSPSALFDEIDAVNSQFEQGRKALERSIGNPARGLEAADLHIGNVGRTADGRWVTHDPTAILGTGDDLARASMELAQPGRVQSFLLNALGGQRRVRDYLNRATSTGGIGQGIL